MVKINQLKKLPAKYNNKISYCAMCTIPLNTSTGIYVVGSRNRKYICRECVHNGLFIDLSDNQPELMEYNLVTHDGKTITIMEVI